ncbi:hypothetical protein MNEG_16602 [Monoraphidium neglectum]|uniref:Glycoside hydrolase family 31 TIM barrel domain-containing protein n=1 Tax=Monoraphidium neglectum TaxID=145388 RepID=A0A0D2ITL1_9CHLO|nr:hypothetical protein MNEG_16602 [Monoraphidium neglectum]KIY91362.1 hypothetical protein MNEG_16602 [Monoraphidium neglectum]|eukprot:XP_013890382.1 hypothetical protein MNEG_16602 [Monoraphidium neglectum]
MERFRNFQPDPVNYQPQELAAFIKGLHDNGQHWVPILDAGIPPVPGYPAYEAATKADIFIKDADGSPYLGQVMTGG